MKIKFSLLITLFLVALVLGNQVQAVDYQQTYLSLNVKYNDNNQLLINTQNDYNTAVQNKNTYELIQIKNNLNSMNSNIANYKKSCITYYNELTIQNKNLADKFRELGNNFVKLENSVKNLNNMVNDAIDQIQLKNSYDDLSGQLNSLEQDVKVELQKADVIVAQNTRMENALTEIKKLEYLKTKIIDIQHKANIYSTSSNNLKFNDLVNQFNGLISKGDNLIKQLTDSINLLSGYCTKGIEADLNKFDSDHNTYNAQVLDIGVKLKQALCSKDLDGVDTQKNALKNIKASLQVDIDLANVKINLFDGDANTQKLYNDKITKLDGLIKSIDEMSNKVYTDSECKIDNGNGNNKVPILNSIGAKSVAIGATLSFTVSATDADNDNLTFSVENKPANAKFENKVFKSVLSPRGSRI